MRTTVAVLLALAVGCKSWHDVPLNEIATRIKPGDRVRTTTVDGEKVVFEVVHQTPHSLTGADYSVSVGDLVQVERREFSFLKTGAAVGVGFVILVFATAVISAAAVATALA
jgi:hypothetical protein